MQGETYEHAWNMGLLTGIHFACKELGLDYEATKVIERRWLEAIKTTQSKEKK